MMPVTIDTNEAILVKAYVDFYSGVGNYHKKKQRLQEVVGRFNEKKKKNVLVTEVFKRLFDEKQNEPGIKRIVEIVDTKEP